MLGPVIHNRAVIERLESLGVRVAEGVSEVPPGAPVIIRSHGVGRDEHERLRGRGAEIIDATCPRVARIHGIVRDESDAGRMLVIIGQRRHPEVEAIAGWCGRHVVLQSPDELREWLASTPESGSAAISVVFQTTVTREVFYLCDRILKKQCTNHRIFDTICVDTCERQRETSELAEKTDAMIVIGGRDSANSRRLADICAAGCERTVFIETAAELDVTELAGYGIVGITAGASTPACNIKEVIQKMSEDLRLDGITEVTEVEPEIETAPETVPDAPEPVPEAQEETPDADADVTSDEAYEEMLVKSIKTLHTGERVTGTVAAITPTEVTVDLGIKQSGYIPISELSGQQGDDGDEEEAVKIGDEIEAFVVRVNDVEGTVMLSKKRLNAIKNMETIEAARVDKTIVEGNVVEDNTGGVVVMVKGVRVFVPASQTGVPRETPLSTLVHSKVRLIITESDKQRRRIVGSIRSAERAERKERAAEMWEEIEPGKKYTGRVRSMTTFGAFVDIGGIDGLLHISEISWKRIKKPEEVLSVGDEIEVTVLSVDRENKKISLRYKREEDDPWTQFMAKFSVGDEISVKVVRIMEFGAFAEVMPDVDGLIHVSQIADYRVEIPSRALSVGQVVDVRIMGIDEERKRISLSIRALLEPRESPDEEEEDGVEDDGAPVIVYDTSAPPELPDDDGGDADSGGDAAEET
jgi:4-hydroxy-3-methylbut-2-enyl diphosphate reductase